MIPGIDVSHWQNDKSTPQKMDFKKAVKAGAKFVFIKVSERGGIDRDFEYNWKSAKDAGLLRGGYHFLRWDLIGLTQARIFCELLKDDPGELPPVADFEAPRRGSHYPSNALLEQFLVEVENKIGRKPMIYTSPGFWNTNGKNKGTNRFDQKWKYYHLWIAHYGVKKPIIPKPWKDFTFWQHGVYPVGIEYGAESKGLDLNWFNGSLIDLFSLAGQGDVQPPDDPQADPPIKPDQFSYLKGRLDTIEKWAKGIGFKL